jgi:membrane-bound lytic murein transglycosylase D
MAFCSKLSSSHFFLSSFDLRRNFVMYKILIGGIVLLLSSACLPRIGSLPEKNPSSLPQAAETQPSLFTPSELEEFFSREYAPSEMEVSSLPPLPSTNGVSVGKLELPISEESNDDFNLEVLPRDQLKKEPNFDIPIVINAKVEQFIQYFQTTLRNRFSNWLARSEKYVPIMRNLLKENGLPEDLVYMALIESGFNPYAYSRMKASGPWQFIYLTGKKYGLKVNWWVDERRDPEKSTIAAAKYLKDLYDMFECWYLAAAGYNAGEKKIASAMKRYRTEDFWELAKYRYLKQETKDYVPQMIAAALIAKDPQKYGFADIEYEEPLHYAKVKVPAATDLRLIARACGITLEELKDLNPELSRWCTPPDDPEYEIKIPSGQKELFLSHFESLQPKEKTEFKTHIVKKGETLRRIARRYRIDVEPILELNRFEKTSRLFAGMHLLIPIPKQSELKPTQAVSKDLDEKSRASKSDEIIYTIKKGDTLWSIAMEMGVNIGALSRWNNLNPETKLMPGDLVKIKVASGRESFETSTNGNGKREIIYVVKAGDTLWGIAKKYNVAVPDIKKWNNLNGKDRIYPSDRLKLKVRELKSSTLNFDHIPSRRPHDRQRSYRSGQSFLALRTPSH